MPTSTDLVTDLPADFEVFGQAVDTQMKTNADAAIAKTIVDAKGDLIAATAADTVARLAIGSNDQVLTADSTAATGMKWATPTSSGMTLLSTTTLSGASTTISSISQSYNSLFMVIYGVTNATADGSFYCRPNSVNEGFFAGGGTGNATSVFREPNSATLFITGTNVVRTDSGNCWSYTINNYTSASALKTIRVEGLYNTGGTGQSYFAGGGLKTTSAITSLYFANSGGNLSTGTVLLYGVK